MISIVNLNKSFNNQKVLSNVNINIKKGEIFGIVGHSGAGKSTLLRCINALLGYDTGSIKISGKEVGKLTSTEIRVLRKNLGMIFQNFNLMNRKNVYENVALPLEVWKYSKLDTQNRVMQLLELVGLTDKAKFMPSELSGGQKQRVAIARALTLNPEILLCDEATSALDPQTTQSILTLLKDISKKMNITIIIVTHQMEVIKEICERAAVMENGEIKTQGFVEELFLRPDNNLKRLLGEDEILPDYGVNIRIFFSKSISQKNIITSMARTLDIDFSIVWGKLEKFRDNVLGSLVINIKDEDKDKICAYLKEKAIASEVL